MLAVDGPVASAARPGKPGKPGKPGRPRPQPWPFRVVTASSA